MNREARRHTLIENLRVAEAFGYTYIIENNRRLLARLDGLDAAEQRLPKESK